jgi:hypothetical protein
MFNILKIFREKVLFDSKFPSTFDKIISIVSNPNNDVKDWGRILIELLEDIIYGAIIKNELFDLEALMAKVYYKFSKSKNQDILLVLIKWIDILNSMTDYDVLKNLPKFIEKIFEILLSNPKHDVYDFCISQLNHFLKDYNDAK